MLAILFGQPFPGFDSNFSMQQDFAKSGYVKSGLSRLMELEMVA